jgi:hypothetical protein
MDPGNLAGAAVSLLVPYFERMGGNVTEDLNKQLSGAAESALKRLFVVIKHKLSHDKYAASQLTGVQERPGRRGRQQALMNALTETLEDDPAFVIELERVIREAHAALGSNLSISQVEGPLVIGGSVLQQGHNVAGHDLAVIATTPASESPSPDTDKRDS